MSPSKLLLPLLSLVFLGVCVPASAQINTDFRITKVESALVESPAYTGMRYDKRGSKAQNWLEVEVAFSWEPRVKEPKYADDLTVNYYILLRAKNPQTNKNILLTGSVTHTNVPQGKDLHSVVYVSPRTLERFFEGKLPSNPGQAVEAVGVTISNQGQIVAEHVGGNYAPQWWSSLQPNAGFVLNKSETPFAPLAWDYYETIKAKSGL